MESLIKEAVPQSNGKLHLYDHLGLWRIQKSCGSLPSPPAKNTYYSIFLFYFLQQAERREKNKGFLNHFASLTWPC